MMEIAKLTRAQVAALLAHALGDAVARQAVDQAIEVLRLDLPDYDRDQALAILEIIAKKPGVIGVTAQFAKSRLILRPLAPAARAR